MAKKIPLGTTVKLKFSKNPNPLSEVGLIAIIDNPGNRTVVARVEELQKTVPLWGKVGYDKAGEWSQEQAEKKLVRVLLKKWVETA